MGTPSPTHGNPLTLLLTGVQLLPLNSLSGRPATNPFFWPIRHKISTWPQTPAISTTSAAWTILPISWQRYQHYLHTRRRHNNIKRRNCLENLASCLCGLRKLLWWERKVFVNTDAVDLKGHQLLLVVTSFALYLVGPPSLGCYFQVLSAETWP